MNHSPPPFEPNDPASYYPYSSLPIETAVSQVAQEGAVANVKGGDIHHSPLIHRSSHLSIEDSQSNIIYLLHIYACCSKSPFSLCSQKQPLLEMICLLKTGGTLVLSYQGAFKADSV